MKKNNKTPIFRRHAIITDRVESVKQIHLALICGEWFSSWGIYGWVSENQSSAPAAHSRSRVSCVALVRSAYTPRR